MRAEELTAEFGIAGTLAFVEAEHGLVKAVISLDGITGELYLHGAQVTAWRPPGEQPVLFTSPKSLFASGKAIRGGIPIIFPWFGPNRHARAAPQHGFARTTPWHLDGVETAGSEALTLTLSLGDVGSPFWPEPFRAIYRATFRTDPVAMPRGAEPRVPSDHLRGGSAQLLRGFRRHRRRDRRARWHRLYRQDRSGTARAADRGARHHRGGDRPRVPRYSSAVRH